MVEKSRCTGCTACVAVCPLDAIVMKADSEGFLYPEVDTARCVNCGKCHKVCPVDKEPTSVTPEKAYYAVADDGNLSRQSSSGGVFSLLANQILCDGGVVFGCAMTEDCGSAHHIGIDSENQMWQLRGSKYVQSALENTLREAKAALAQGKTVLFSGTPCQIGGVKAYLGDAENLLTVDVICHGAPSPMVWRDYLTALEKDMNSKAVQVCFRDKTEGWQRYSLVVEFENGKTYRKNVTQDLYLRGFVENLYLRPACHGCVFKNGNYKSDLTIGDLWGAKRIKPELQGIEGISLLIPHTPKGQQLVKLLQACTLEEIPVDAALKSNPSYYKPVGPSPFRTRALSQIRIRGTRKTLRKYCGDAFGAKIRKKMTKLTGK